jgi:anti-sigma regulatory factor (Ser/Thr protein kinase)
MVNHRHVALKADDRSYFAILKKQVHTMAKAGGFSEQKVGEIDIIVAEMVSNLVKHAGGGQVLVKLVEEKGAQGIELISIDHGPGMTDITRMVADGVSTKNTLGQGLGAMKRLSEKFQVYSLKDWGTIILCRVFEKNLQDFTKPAKEETRYIVLPKPGEEACGDGVACKSTATHIKLFLGDGLGHGPEAAIAIKVGIKAFENDRTNDPVDIIKQINEAARKTRGLVGMVAVFDIRQKQWNLCGVGNTMARVSSNEKSHTYMSYNGIIGLNVPNTLKVQEVPYAAGQYVVLCSDGFKSKWDTIKYPVIHKYDPSILAAALLKDYARQTDDMSVAVCKLNM